MTALALLLTLTLTPIARAQDTTEYRVGPRDLVEVRVLEIPDLNVERRVTDGGTLTLPILGDVPVTGLTANEAAARIEKMLTEQYVNRANVSVVIKEFANKPVSIVGAVQKPGFLNISGRWDLLQAISAAGGLTANAGKKIYVIRRGEHGFGDTLEINTDDLFRSANGIWNIPIFPSDTVNIPARSVVNVFCLGEVNSPGAVAFDSDDRITVLTVIAKAGGLSERASNHITIKRRQPDGTDREIKVDYNDIVKGRSADVEIKPDDVVIVNRSFF